MALKETFEAANAAGDGHLTKKEAEAAGMKQVVENFDAIDSKGMGFVTLAQVKGFRTGKKASVATAKEKKASVAEVRETMARVAERKARGESGGNIEERFKRANTTGDGKLTRQQIGKAGNRPLGLNFDKLDVEGKGYLTLEQVTDFVRKEEAREPAVRKPRPAKK